MHRGRLSQYLLPLTVMFMTACSSVSQREHLNRRHLTGASADQQTKPNDQAPDPVVPNGAQDKNDGPQPNVPNKSPNGVEENLPAYLFSLDEANGIDQLVDPYRAPPFAPPSIEEEGNFEQLAQFIEDFANGAMDLPNLQPGRTFTVYIQGRDDVNARADDFQNIFFDTGLFEHAESQDVLSVLCHEMAHSTKNHAVNLYDNLTNEQLNALDAFDMAASNYLSAQYNDTTGTYTHNISGYSKVQGLWAQVEPVLSQLYKHDESEADIIGGMICASLGMSPQDYLIANESLNEIIKNLYESNDNGDGDFVAPEDLNNGEKFKVPSEAVYAFLFPLDSHPTDTERLEQLQRVNSAIEKWYDAGQNLYDQWNQDFQTYNSFNLTTSDSFEQLRKEHFITATTSDGRMIRVIKHVGCRH